MVKSKPSELRDKRKTELLKVLEEHKTELAQVRERTRRKTHIRRPVPGWPAPVFHVTQSVPLVATRVP